MKIGLVMPVSWGPLRKFVDIPDDAPIPLEFVFGSELAAELVRMGNEVHIFTICNKVCGTRTIAGRNLHVHIAGYHAHAMICALQGYYFEARQLRSLMREFPCDVYNAHWQYEFALPVLGFWGRHVVTVRDNPWKVLWMFKPHSYRFVRMLIAYYVLARAGRLSVASPYMADYCRRWHGHQRPIAVIPNAVPTIDCTGVVKRPKDVVDFVEISNGFSSCKNIAKLIDAFLLLQDKTSVSVRLHIYGNCNDERGEAGQYIARKGYVAPIVLHGSVAHADMLRDVASYADVFVHVSREESFGNVIVEAMQLGLPTIVGEKSGAAPWVAGNGETGLLVDVNDAESIADSMQRMAENPALRMKFGAAAKDRAQRNFSISSVAAKYEEMYHDVIGRNK